MQRFLLCIFAVLFTSFSSLMLFAQDRLMTLTYPLTKKVDTVDDYFGTKIPDPYRWLEDDNSVDTQAWVQEQNRVTQAYLSQIPYRTAIHHRLSALWNYPKYGTPFREGECYYYFKNDGLQNQAVLYQQKGLNGEPEVLIDPNQFSRDGTVALGSVSFSKDARYVAYEVAQAGSDWQQIVVMEVVTRKILPDTLHWIKFSGIAWRGDGFYYSRYDAPDEKSRLSRKNEFHKVYYHRIGHPQSDDQLIYVDRQHPLRNAYAQTTEDERFLIVGTSEGTSGRELWYWDLQDPQQKALQLLIKGFDYEPGVVDNAGDHLLVRTNHDAPNYKLVLVDPKRPAKENWQLVIPEQQEVLEGVSTAGGKLFAHYLKDAATQIVQYDLHGQKEKDIRLPGIGTASGFSGKKEDKTLFYTFTSYVHPPTIYQYDLATGHAAIFREAEVKFDPKEYETKQVFFNSKDGTRVPLFLSYKKGMKQDGKNPVLLYGYGGFNIPQTPGFNISNLFFMEQGGIFAVVNLRGGNEYGEAWHRAGMLEKKQNVFDDFIGAAEYLIREKYTNKKRIAIRGGSNGGLLIGACMTQRPDLFKVAIPQVGVMDMLRYQKFTIGWAWAVEYGSSDNEDQFKYLIKYSPLHNLKKGVHYPATLITTADHDDRVVPAHSFKFAAALQECNAGPHPALIRIETRAGHGAGKPTSKQIEEATDIWAFVMYNLGMQFK